VKRFGLGGAVLGIAAAISMLSGCALRALPVSPVQGNAALSSGVRGAAVLNGDLLYVANQKATFGISVLTFPGGTIVQSIANIGQPRGICSDPKGNVWVTTVQTRTHPYYIYKFAHGEKRPVETLHPRKDVYGCAVDSTTGDLAVIGHLGSSSSEIDIFPPAGKMQIIPISFNPIALAYDNRSNLFIDGVAPSGTRELVEMPKGSKNLTRIALGRLSTWNPGSVVWDGKDIAVGIGSSLKASFIDRVDVTSSGGKVIGQVRLKSLSAWPEFAIDGNQIVATKRRAAGATTAQLFKYPKGGKPTATYSGFSNPAGMAISAGSK
jgi:hypothetical protein